MSDVDWIFIVLVGLYAIECMVWLKPGVVAFPSIFGRCQSPLSVLRLVGNDFGTVVASGPAPWDATFLIEPLPVSISPGGLVPFVPTSPSQLERRTATGLYFNWEQLKDIRCEETSVVVGHAFVCKTRNRRTSQQLCDTVKHFAGLADEERVALIEGFIADSFDVDFVRKRFDDWTTATHRLKIASTLLFMWTIPLGLFLYYAPIDLPVKRDWQLVTSFLGVMFAIWTWTILETYFTHKKLLPHDVGGRWKAVFTSMVSPVVPMRASDRLARDLFAFVHPITFVAAIRNESVLKVVAVDAVRDSHFPRLPELPIGASDAAINVIQWAAGESRRLLQHVMNAQGMSTEKYLIPTARESAKAVSYCSRCGGEFEVLDAICSPCGNRLTVPFE